RDRGNAGGARGEPVIDDAAGQRSRRFDHVEPGKVFLFLARLAPRAPVFNVTDGDEPVDEEIAVERENDVGSGKIVSCVEVFTEGQLNAGAHRVAPGGLPLVPLRLKVRDEKLADLRGHRKRRDSLDEEAQTRAAQRLLRRSNAKEGRAEL